MAVLFAILLEVLKEFFELLIKINGPGIVVFGFPHFKSYDAVFAATGANTSLKLGIPGDDAPGVINALDFLYDINMGEGVKVGQRVAVIGGGNSAVDAARVAKLLGSW